MKSMCPKNAIWSRVDLLELKKFTEGRKTLKEKLNLIETIKEAWKKVAKKLADHEFEKPVHDFFDDRFGKLRRLFPMR